MKETRTENSKIVNSEEDVATLRKRIDDIDEQILEMIGRRLEAARAIGRIKQQAGITVVDNRREGEIFQRLLSLKQETLKAGSLYRIFRSIIGAGRSVQKQPSKTGVLPIYAVFGDPIGHSLSPVMHNSALAQAGLDGCYLACRVKDIAAAVTGIRGLGLRGASITIPHKMDVMKHLDRVDSMAAGIGAVNTVVNRRGVLHGCNTDCSGAVKALADKTVIDGQDVALVGAGGAARAIGFGIRQAGGRLTIINRTAEKGEKLASDLDCDFKPLSEIKELPYRIIVNATSVGMAPRDDRIPLDTDLLERETVVMDSVYSPLKTRFLTQAANKGCTTIDGVAMFVNQGAVQFELWTGRKAPVDVMRRVVLDELRAQKVRY